MPLDLVCARESCDRPLHLRDGLAGRRIVCPHCGQAQIVPGPEDEAVNRRLRGWGLVRLGIHLVYRAECAGGILGLVWIAWLLVLLVLALAIAGTGASDEGTRTLANLATGVGILLLIANGLTVLASLVGMILCAFVPTRTGLRTLAIANLALTGLAVVCAGAAAIGLSHPQPPAAAVVGQIMAILLAIAARFTLLVLLRDMARSLRARWLADEVSGLIRLIVCLVGTAIGSQVIGAFLLGCLGFLSAGAGDRARIAVVILVVILQVGLLIIIATLALMAYFRGLRILREVREAIDRRLGRLEKASK